MRIVLGMFVLGLVCAGAAHAEDQARAGKAAVFTISNEAEANNVLAFKVRHDGTLGPANMYATGGKGTGDSLGSQGALVLSHDQRFLIAVNAGSDELSVFEVHAAHLKLRDRVASGGMRPISVTERCGLVYVVHAGSDDVMGFHLDRRGKLTAIEGSHRLLSGTQAGPAQIELSPDARTLIVSEKQRNVITTYHVDAYGKLSEPMVNASQGMTPFGFELTSRGVLVVSEAATGSMSSYALGGDQLAAISSAVPDDQKAPCWVEITADDRFAFTANAGSSSISSYDISDSGALSLRDPRAAELGEGGTPLDLAFARDGHYLYVLDRGHARIAGFEVHRRGELSLIEESDQDLPAFASGLAAY
ncbi:MAG TPA: beta-propeller fold lactonase family protein [Polyangiales bacterium]|nr:beta-propeller fold lactonase family protein [Polyangiales bacterium]